jgi:hypothetical protein
MGRKSLSTHRGDIVLCLSLLVASGWLGVNLYASQEMTWPLLDAAGFVGLGLGLGAMISKTE